MEEPLYRLSNKVNDTLLYAQRVTAGINNYQVAQGRRPGKETGTVLLGRGTQCLGLTQNSKNHGNHTKPGTVLGALQ